MSKPKNSKLQILSLTIFFPLWLQWEKKENWRLVKLIKLLIVLKSWMFFHVATLRKWKIFWVYVMSSLILPYVVFYATVIYMRLPYLMQVASKTGIDPSILFSHFLEHSPWWCFTVCFFSSQMWGILGRCVFPPSLLCYAIRALLCRENFLGYLPPKAHV